MSKFKKTLHFLHVAETKGAERYGEVPNATSSEILKMQDAVIGTIYIRKTALGDAQAPERLTVTLES